MFTVVLNDCNLQLFAISHDANIANNKLSNNKLSTPRFKIQNSLQHAKRDMGSVSIEDV